MNNLEVIKRFLEGNKGQTPLRGIQNGYYIYKGRTLTTDGQSLINYTTEIAYKKDRKIIFKHNKILSNNKQNTITTKLSSKTIL